MSGVTYPLCSCSAKESAITDFTVGGAISTVVVGLLERVLPGALLGGVLGERGPRSRHRHEERH
ncbi:hypothetical protein [Corynebacterium sp.]|uniref:hypothetical protein n=1 Tax=Corynebacterium sp. TaxID=1720 RepID=UPI0026E0AAFC|nr:hypothetical protein [Corynebacterium sp.]MDO5511847.1 hypothetical protein [Corynebacterium sp.]